MKTRRLRTMVFMLAALALLMLPGMAMATAGDVILNDATLDYTVSGVGQTQMTSAVNFTVDRKVIFTVAAITGATNVQPSLQDAYVSFNVDNQSNDELGFILTAVNGATQTITMTGVTIYIDDGNDAWDGIATETAYTPGNNAFDILEGGATQMVFIVADTPGTAVNGQVEEFYLVARATEPTLAVALTDTGGANGEDTEEIVLADGSSAPDYKTAGVADAAYDNYYSDLGTFTVSSAIVTFAKTFLAGGAVVWDPVIWDGASRKAIPGGYVEYVITIANNAAASASAVLTTVTDTLPAGVTQQNYLDTNLNTATPSSTIASNIVVKNCATVLVRACETVAQGFTSAVSSLDLTVLLPAEGGLAAGELAPGDTVEIHYMVSID